MPSKTSTELTRLQARLAGQILEQIREEKLEPGSPLSAKGLAHKFGVSRTPVSVALQYLTEIGAARFQPGIGHVVNNRKAKLAKVKLAPEQTEDEKLYLKIAEDQVASQLPRQFSESDLMRRYGVSRRVLLKVLERMSRDGAVERKQGYGWRFVELLSSQQAHADSYYYRSIIEPAGILAPTFKLDKQWAIRCRQSHEEIMGARPGQLSSIQLFQVNADFHTMIAASSNNRFILSSIEQQNQIRRFLNYHWVYGQQRIIVVAQEHMGILDALERNEREFAAALMRRHLALASDVVPKTLKAEDTLR
ncbi:GntR family transcriptional regulator [Steroidobacter sp.]|uniref:GntR family transcriptional regulator n=1 Tax=Steroidobacter sp. TaxID=1978227 RepID=UPI002ED779DC